MNYAGFLRVKNEARWIGRVLESLQLLCERTYLLDDHSTDDTCAIAASFAGVTVFPSHFEGLNETRDKQWLLDMALQDGWADYLVAIDGDEQLEPTAPDKIRRLCGAQAPLAASLRVIYLWDRYNQWRADGVYGRFYRPSIFRMLPDRRKFVGTTANGNLHCTNVPYSLISQSVLTEIKLLHWGYFDKTMRMRKYMYYNSVDPQNAREDFYRHVIQGDATGPLADEQLVHAGPLQLAPLTL